jgi:hypothetical protein
MYSQTGTPEVYIDLAHVEEANPWADTPQVYIVLARIEK